ncbi:MAG: hypothetical protein PUE13_01580 [Clostridiales bacterium]|nr:hypothetical protein [Clostridiales bacterium]
MKSKKITALCCAITALTCASASAQWQFAGYDTTNPPEYGKIFNEVIDGKYTSKQKIEKLEPEAAEWKFEGYELQYPHAGYERLYLEGNIQRGITRTTSQFPQWETKFRDFMWEVSGEHRIFQRQQTKINNKYWEWDFGGNAYDESLVFVPTTRYATVTDSFEDYGIANLDMDGNYVFDINGNIYNEEKYTLYSDFNVMPRAFNVKLDEEGNPTKEIVEGDFFDSANLSVLDENNQFAVTDWDIAQYIELMKSKFVTGPSYYGENGTKDVAAMYFANKDYGWNWDWDTVINTREAQIDWTKPVYEMAEPYNYYQYLIVNGLVMDGRNDTPRIYRFTGGKATPDVEWKYAFVEADYPYNIVEYKFIRGNDGKMVQAYDENGVPEHRYPSGEFGNSYFKVTDTEVQYWIRDTKGDRMVDSISRTDSDFGNWYEGYINAAGYVTE